MRNTCAMALSTNPDSATLDTHYLDSLIEREPEMDLDTQYFGITVIHSDTYEWSKYYPIVLQGVIEQSPSKELKAFSNNVLQWRAVRDLAGTICYDTDNGEAKLTKPTFQTMAGVSRACDNRVRDC